MMIIQKITMKNYLAAEWHCETILVRCDVETDIANVGEIGMIVRMDRELAGIWKIKFVEGGEGLRFWRIKDLLSMELGEGKYSFYHLDLKP